MESASRQPLSRRIARNAGRWLLVAGLAAAAGCVSEGPKVGLKSDDVAGRIIAMKQAAQRRDKKAVPALVDALSSDDPAERFYAISALQRISGQTFGYHYFDPESVRAQSVQSWKQWLAGAQPAAATAGTH
jgi:hypothetical protein